MSAVPAGLAGLAAVIATRVPGSPGGVRALAASWRGSGETVGEGASLMSSAALSAPSWQGASAQAFAAAASSLVGSLSGTAGELGRGAGVLDAYAGVLERAHGMAAELQAQAARLLVTSIASPATAPACQAAATVITTAFNALLSTVDLAATTTAASLGTAASDSRDRRSGRGRVGSGAADQGEKGLLDDIWQFVMLLTTSHPLSEEDKKRLRAQADGGADWDVDANQGGIGDCYLLATLQSYSQTEEGQQLLRNHVRWDEKKNCFVVTLYDNGKPVDVEVDDYYSDGTKDDRGRPTLMSLYERAYGKHFGHEELADGGNPENDGMKVVSGAGGRHVSTMNIPLLGGNIPLNKYNSQDWEDMERSVKEGKPVTGVSSGDFSGGDKVKAVTDTNGDGKIDSENPGSNGGAPDKKGDYRLVGGDYDRNSETEVENHVYTVVDIDDEYVTLRNPWGGNDTPSDGRKDGGLIRITREDYEKHFAYTGIGEAP